MKNKNWLDKIILFCLENKLIVTLILLAIISWGIMVAPFDWDIAGLPRDPVPVDAIGWGVPHRILRTRYHIH
jgi:Cu(I)/Ag(I) efflux system membrane protein CusA/SilA